MCILHLFVMDHHLWPIWKHTFPSSEQNCLQSWPYFARSTLASPVYQATPRCIRGNNCWSSLSSVWWWTYKDGLVIRIHARIDSVPMMMTKCPRSLLSTRLTRLISSRNSWCVRDTATSCCNFCHNWSLLKQPAVIFQNSQKRQQQKAREPKGSRPVRKVHFFLTLFKREGGGSNPC